jgi:DNA helicase-2/ATP-dependent DNA helicase PcrA
MEDGLFPHQRSIADPQGLEEERRLCYVGVTRAKETLYVTYAEQRRMHGMDNFAQPSRFIAEIPAELVEEVRPRAQVSRPMRNAPTRGGRGRGGRGRGGGIAPGEELGVRLGQRVHHAKFGDGVILNCSGQGAHAQVEVNFEAVGTKILVLAYANLDLM